MSDDANREFIQRYFDEVTNRGDLDLADELFAPDYIHHDPANPDPKGVVGVEDVEEEDVLEDAADLEDDADAISGDIEVETDTDENER